MKTREINVSDVEYIAFELAKELTDGAEPIPEFYTRYPNILESCISQPFQSVGDVDLYPTLLDKASIMFYLINKNHPFVNGNKRMAVTALLVFLFMNGVSLKLELDDKELKDLAIYVAASDASRMNETVFKIKDFLLSNTKTDIGDRLVLLVLDFLSLINRR